MKRSKTSLNKFSNSPIMTIFSLWFFGELAFNVLPIAVILIINLAFGESFEQISLLPDWSFASVVLFGGCLSMFIELKTKFQKDSSHKVFSGTRLLTIALIASVISLTMALLREKGVGIDSIFLGKLQIYLFIFSAFYLILPIVYKVNFLDTHMSEPNTANVNGLLTFLSFSLNESDENIRHSAIAITENMKIISEKYTSCIIGGDVESDFIQLESQISRIEKNIAHVKSEWEKVLQAKQLASGDVSSHNSESSPIKTAT